MTDEVAPPSPAMRWGRIVVLIGILLIAFAVGRMSAPDGVSEERVGELRSDVAEAERQVETLELALETREAEVTPAPTETAEATEPAFDEAGRRIYVVQSGDTMRGIAEEFCGDVGLADFIASFNDIEDPRVISVGTRLKIPKDCTG